MTVMTIHRAERPYISTESPSRGRPPYRNGHVQIGHASLDWLHPHEAAAKLSPGKWRKDGPRSAYAQCPCHADDSPSLHLTLKNDTLLVHCFSCGAEAKDSILAMLAERGLAVFPPKDEPNRTKPKLPKGVRTKVATHLYHHADGSLLYRKNRYEWHHNGQRFGAHKVFSWERLDGGTWANGLDEQRAPLYRLPELLAAPGEPIHFCEGEKCADAVAGLGLLATTLPSQKLDKGIDLSVCTGRVIYNHVDNDESGHRQAAERADAFRAAGAAKVVALTYEDCGPKGDVNDWIAKNGGTLEALQERCRLAETSKTNAVPWAINSSAAMVWPDTKRGAPIHKSQANIAYFFERAGVALSFNAFTSTPSVRWQDVEQRLDDEVICRLSMGLHRAGLDPSEAFFRNAVLDLALANSYHPVLEYLDGLTWDGQPRLDRWVVDYLGAENTELHRAFGRLQLLAAVKRVREPGFKKDEMLVLEGPQGIGKSSAIDILAGQFGCDSLKVGQDSKEIIEQTGGAWLVEFAEMEGMTNRDVSTVKAMMSRSEDRARLAYGRMAVSRPRQWVAFGTTNGSEYLRDPTGNRRFWPLPVTRVAFEALKRDRDQLWAEAASRVSAGESTVLPATLWSAAAAEQSERVPVSPWQMSLESAHDGCEGRITISELFRYLGIERSRQDPRAARGLGEAMERMGWVKARHRGSNSSRLDQREHCYCKGSSTAWVRLP